MMNDSEVEKIIKAIIGYKGYPWSYTEFERYKNEALNDLRKKGATKEQIEKFKNTVESAPIRNGRFNSYSGD